LGSAAVVGGGVLYYLGWHRDAQPSVSFAPLPGGVAMVTSCSF
jgi:hypothetical protein